MLKRHQIQVLRRRSTPWGSGRVQRRLGADGAVTEELKPLTPTPSGRVGGSADRPWRSRIARRSRRCSRASRRSCRSRWCGGCGGRQERDVRAADRRRGRLSHLRHRRMVQVVLAKGRPLPKGQGELATPLQAELRSYRQASEGPAVERQAFSSVDSSPDGWDISVPRFNFIAARRGCTRAPCSVVSAVASLGTSTGSSAGEGGKRAMRHTRILVTHYGGADALRAVEEKPCGTHWVLDPPVDWPGFLL